MTLYNPKKGRKELEDQVRSEQRRLPHGGGEYLPVDTGPAPEQNHSDIAPVSKRPRKEVLNVRLDPEDHAALQRDSERRGIGMGAIVRELVHKYLKGAGLR